MSKIKFVLILFLLSIKLDCFYISKQPIPTLFLNEQTRFNITHNAGPTLNFRLVSGPSFFNLRPNGQIILAPNLQGSFQTVIQAFNSSTNTNLISFSYIVNVLNRSKQLQKALWIIDQQNYFGLTSSRAIQIETDNYDFRTPVLTNQNIRLRLTTKNHGGQVVWFYENLPQTITGGRSTGVIQGYSQTEGSLVIEVTAIDSGFRMGQIYLFLRFNQISSLLQQESFPSFNRKSSDLLQQRIQNAILLQNEIKTLLDKKNKFQPQRSSILSRYKNTTLIRQQTKLNEEKLMEKIRTHNNELQAQKFQRQKTQQELANQKARIDQARKTLSDRQKDYAKKLEQSRRFNLTLQQLVNEFRPIRMDFDSRRDEISKLQNLIFRQEGEVREIQNERSRSNVTYVSLQKQQVRSRELLQIRKNIEFQYLIKKAQTDNKVRRNEDLVFLSQTNYDFGYAEYKKQSLLYFQKVIESSYIQAQIQLALQDYQQISKTLNRAKINYVIASGAVNTLKVAKQQLSKLSAYAVNSIISNTSNSLTETQKIEAQAKLQTEQHPFTGCRAIGNFAWAGSGKVKSIGKNWIVLGSEETVNYGKCTRIRTNVQGVSKPQAGNWIQFSGYYWDGAIQATSITLLSMN